MAPPVQNMVEKPSPSPTDISKAPGRGVGFGYSRLGLLVGPGHRPIRGLVGFEHELAKPLLVIAVGQCGQHHLFDFPPLPRCLIWSRGKEVVLFHVLAIVLAAIGPWRRAPMLNMAPGGGH